MTPVLSHSKGVEASSRPSATLTPGSPLYLFAANRTLSGSALKVLLAVLEAGEGAAILRNDFKRLTGLSGNHAILNAVQECVDNEWLLRRYQCRWCGSSIESSYDTIRLTECQSCGRKMTPEPVFCLQVPEGVSLEHGGVLKKHTGVSLQHTSGVPNEQTGVPLKHTPLARADLESVARIRDSDSRIPPQSGGAETGRVVYASGKWQQITEKLAKDSARRIRDKSVGFHVKVWAYARKLDWEKGERRFR